MRLLTTRSCTPRIKESDNWELSWLSKWWAMSIKYRHNERLKSMSSQGYKVLYDPTADCNCPFSSVAFALRDLGFFKSANTFRNDVISYMDTYEVSADEYPMELFAATPWSDKSYSDGIIIHFQYQNHGCLNSCTGRTWKKKQ